MIVGQFAFHEFNVHALTAGGDLVIAQITLDADAPGGGRLHDEELHWWKLGEDGRVVAMRHYVDTAKHAAAARGVDTTAG